VPPDEKRKGHKVRESPRELVEPGWHSDLYRPETEVKQPGELLLRLVGQINPSGKYEIHKRLVPLDAHDRHKTVPIHFLDRLTRKDLGCGSQFASL